MKSSSVLRLIYRPSKSIKTANTVCICLFFLFEYLSFSCKALIIFKFWKTQSTKENSNQAHETNKKTVLKEIDMDRVNQNRLVFHVRLETE